MGFDLFVIIFYLVAKCSLVIASVVFFISGLDEVFFDIYFFIRQAYRKIFIYTKHKPLDEKKLLEKEEQYIAIFIPAWQEENVISRMLLNTINSVDYKKYHVFVGTYPNDERTIIEVEKVRQIYPNVSRIVCPHDGPTNKADNLNWIFQGMMIFEEENNLLFEIVAIHDSEDIIHPLSLKLYNYLIPRFSMVQLPVYPLEVPLMHFTAGAYIDDFAEFHSKDMLVRERLDGVIPAAGVGCAFSRKVLNELAKRNKNLLFNTDSLTEDYEFGMKLRDLPGKKIFVRQSIKRIIRLPNGKTKIKKEVIATREFFPSKFLEAVRQRARWTLGIAIQGWKSLGWKGSFFTKLMYYKDRKVLITSIVNLIGYFAFFYFVIAWVTKILFGYSIFPPLVKGDSFLIYLLLIDLLFMLQRLLHRVFFVTKLYGIGHGLMSILRVLWGNFINFCAVALALKQYMVSLITGEPVVWIKTTHEYPTEEHLRIYRRKLGDLLLEKKFVKVEQLDEALKIQEKTGGKLGEILIRLGYLKEEDLVYALDKQVSPL